MTSPAQRVRQQLAAARAAGSVFDDAWAAALDGLPAPPAGARLADRREADGWRAAIAATRPAWRSAYEREPPTRAERAVETLAAVVG